MSMDENFWRNKKVFISGADGFIGSSFRQALKLEGALVYGASLSSAKPFDILKTAELKDFLQKENFDVFIHCAAVDGNAKFKEGNADKVFDDNIDLADSVLAAISITNIPDVILVSSAEVYKVLNCSDSMEAGKSYAAAKLAIEDKFSAFASSFNKRLMIIRASNVYGPGEHRPDGAERVIPTMIRKAFAGETIEIWGDGEDKRYFLHIEDLVGAVILAAQNNYFKTFFISGPDSISIKKLAELIISLTGSSSQLAFKDGGKISPYSPCDEDRLIIPGFHCRLLRVGLRDMIKNRNLLVTLADKNFVAQAKQLFSSVYRNSGWRGDYLLLSYGLEAADKDWFKERGILVFDCPTLPKLGEAQKYLDVTMLKILLLQEYFKRWRRVIFLDADIIVRASLNGLLRLKGFAAPKAEDTFLKDEFLVNDKSRGILMEYDLSADAFCSGVLYFETKIIKKDSFLVVEKLSEKFFHYGFFAEESILNLYFYKKWHKLSRNYQSAPWHFRERYGVPVSMVKARILHFFCFEKPWEEKSYFFSEWSRNLSLADDINLWRRPKAKTFFGRALFLAYVEYCKLVKKINYKKRRENFCSFLRKVDALIGRCGIALKKKNPLLYKSLTFWRQKK